MGNYKYKAFISYSHKDHHWGRWLHRRLESYRVPKHLVKNGFSKRLRPIFRDREELAAADDLGEKIEQALAASECLIVICSPHAAVSHWVNKEILSFKRTNRGAKIFSIIVEDKAFSRYTDGCMPPALRFQMGADGELTDEPAEPLAADLRTSGDGKRLGVLKIISGMLGVGLDELVQRDMQKNRNRVMAITVSALATVLAMGTLTAFAVSARIEAEARRVEAEQRRNAAEDMIEFMITELKPELEAVERLKPLVIIGERAAKYYEDQPLTSHNDNALGRRARVFHLIGEIEEKHGDFGKAQARFEEAYDSTKILLARNPNDAELIFDHAQSAFWLGYVYYKNKDYSRTEPYYLEYENLAETLAKLEPNSIRAIQEKVYAYTNLGILLHKGSSQKSAIEIFIKADKALQLLTEKYPKNLQYRIDRATVFAWQADANAKMKNFQNAYRLREKQVKLYENSLKLHKNNNKLQVHYVNGLIGWAKIAIHLDEQDTTQTILKNAIFKASKLSQAEPNNLNLQYSFAYLKLLEAKRLIQRNDIKAGINLLKEVEALEIRMSTRFVNSKIEREHLSNQRKSIIASLEQNLTVNSESGKKHDQ